MDKNIEILLGSEKNSNSVNIDNYERIELYNKTSKLIEYQVNKSVSSTNIFDSERENNQVYRIYGKIEFLSLLNNLKLDYLNIADFFQPQVNDSKNIINSFDFYLVRPTTGYTEINIKDGLNRYVRCFEVIATPQDFEIFPAGFNNNIFNEQIYAFSFNRDINVSKYYDDLNFPITELYLFAQYIKGQNSDGYVEELTYQKFNQYGDKTIIPLIEKTYAIGDILKTAAEDKITDIIEFDPKNFIQTQIEEQIFRIKTRIKDNINKTIDIRWKYNPFIPLKLRYFVDQLNVVSSGSTSYDELNSVPFYAVRDENGNYIWRDIQPQGYIDPLSGIGVDYPFVNGNRYLFAPIVLSVVSDLNDLTTKNLFNNITFIGDDTNITDNGEKIISDKGILEEIKPLNLLNFGKPCL